MNNMDDIIPVITHTRKITFEVFDTHPNVGDYCVFANETVDKTDKNKLDFIFVEDIKTNENGTFVVSKDLYVPVMLKYCWKINMSVHD